MDLFNGGGFVFVQSFSGLAVIANVLSKHCQWLQGSE